MIVHEKICYFGNKSSTLPVDTFCGRVCGDCLHKYFFSTALVISNSKNKFTEIASAGVNHIAWHERRGLAIGENLFLLDCTIRYYNKQHPVYITPRGGNAKAA